LVSIVGFGGTQRRKRIFEMIDEYRAEEFDNNEWFIYHISIGGGPYGGPYSSREIAEYYAEKMNENG
jgi:hypothetical protein